MDGMDKRPGRPPRGDRTLTGAERAKAYRERRNKQALERPDAPWGAWVMLVSLVVGAYRDHRREKHVRSVLAAMPLVVRARVAQTAADFWSNESAPTFWEAYLRWHAEDPERWPMPLRPAGRRGRKGAALDHDEDG